MSDQKNKNSMLEIPDVEGYDNTEGYDLEEEYNKYKQQLEQNSEPSQAEIEKFFTDSEDAEKSWFLEKPQIKIISHLKNKDPAKYVELKPKLGGIIRDIESAIKKETKRIRLVGDEELDKTTIKTIYPGMPIKYNGEIPMQYRLVNNRDDQYSLFLLQLDKDGDTIAIPISYEPLVVSSVINNISNSEETYLELMWHNNGRWMTKIAEYKDVFNNNKIQSIASMDGYPVKSNNAKLMVDWLTRWEAVNKKIFPVKLVTPQMGWVNDDLKWGFIVGKTHIKSDDNVKKVEFKPENDGRAQIIDGFKQKGSFDGWKKAINAICDFNLVKLAVYASLAAPLIRYLKQDGFTVEWSYKTSNGKTTALSAAGSCWGNPNPQAAGSIIASWSSTIFNLEIHMSILNNLPMIIDESMQVKDQSTISKLLYSVTAGQSRGGGTKDGGMRKKYKWRTIALSSGENMAIDSDKSGGSVARVVSLDASPFDNKNATEEIKRLMTGISENYGHAGPIVVKWLVENMDQRDRLIELFNSYIGAVRRGAEKYSRNLDNNALNRMSKNLAVLWLAGYLAEEILELGWDPKETIRQTIKISCKELVKVDRETEALKQSLLYVQQNPKRICYNDSSYIDGAPGGDGWFGFKENTDDWEFVAFFPDALEKFLDDRGYSSKSIIKQWKHANYTRCNPGRHKYRISKSKLSSQPNMIVIKRSVVEKLGFGDEEDGNIDQG